MSEYVDLKALPPEHPMRNTALHVICARSRWIKPDNYPRRFWNGEEIIEPKAQWKTVERAWAISMATFNSLGPVWTDAHEWQGKVPEAPLAYTPSDGYPSPP